MKLFKIVCFFTVLLAAAALQAQGIVMVEQETRNGKTSSFKVEATCQYAGVNGLRGVWRENQKVIIDMCVSPNVGLPLAVTMNEEDGSNSTTMKLMEFRP